MLARPQRPRPFHQTRPLQVWTQENDCSSTSPLQACWGGLRKERNKRGNYSNSERSARVWSGHRQQWRWLFISRECVVFILGVMEQTTRLVLIAILGAVGFVCIYLVFRPPKQ